MRRVNFNDGEGLTFEDLNLISKLCDRHISLAFRQDINPGVVVLGSDNPLYVSGFTPIAQSGTGNRTLTPTDALWVGAAAAPGVDDPLVYPGRSLSAAYTLDANTSGSVWRRDILEAQFAAETTGENETRDFKDAVTGVVTTTSMAKRRLRMVNIQVKKGTDQASEAAADANEPAPTAGWVKILSALVDNTGACTAAKIKHHWTGYHHRKFYFGPASGTALADAAGFAFNGVTASAVSRWDSTTSSAAVRFPIILPGHSRIREVRFVFRPGSGGSDSMQLRLIRQTHLSALQIGDTLVSPTDGADQEMVLTGINQGELVLPTDSYEAYFLTNSAAAMRVYGVRVIADLP